MNRPCGLSCRHCTPGNPCQSMSAYLAEEAAEWATATALDEMHASAKRVHPAGLSWFDRSDPYPVRSGYLIDDPIHDGRF